MTTKDKLLETPGYLLTKYQNEIYRQFQDYMKTSSLNQKAIAAKLNVSDAYVSQILNGNFNFTLKKLIELGLMIDKVPIINFVSKEDYWRLRDDTKKYKVTYIINIGNHTSEYKSVNKDYTNLLPGKHEI